MRSLGKDRKSWREKNEEAKTQAPKSLMFKEHAENMGRNETEQERPALGDQVRKVTHRKALWEMSIPWVQDMTLRRSISVELWKENEK